MRTFLLLLCWPLSLFSQNTIGLPDITNYSKEIYGAGLQNWDFQQDKNGIIYIANNEGLLSFDGKNWSLYPLPNKTIVRSVSIGTDNKIYVGGQDELGFFSPAPNGALQYHSLLQSIPKADRSFGDVWDIVPAEKEIFFRSTSKIFRFEKAKVTTYPAISEWSALINCRGVLYAHDFQKGLMRFDQKNWVGLSSSALPLNDPVTGILAFPNDTAIITTLKHGLFVFANNKVSKFTSPNSPLFETDRIYAATKINENWMALATSNRGVYIIDRKGNIVQSFTGTEGVQNNNVLSIFLDRQKNLWLGLDNGIDLISYNSAIKKINPSLKNASGYAALIFNQQLYVGTSNGLYATPLQPKSDLSFSKGNFSLVENTTGQTWSLAAINNQMLLGHHEGAFSINGNKATLLSGKPGFWNFVPSPGSPTSQIISGHYNGVDIFDLNKNAGFASTAVNNFSESSRFVCIDNENNIWISHPYHGVFKLVKKQGAGFLQLAYGIQQGLPSGLNNHVYKIKNELVVATEKGIFLYNKLKDRFEPAAFYQKILGDQSIRYLKEDKEGNIWFIHEKTIGVIDFSGSQPKIIYLPELQNKMLSGFEFIYPVNENNIFLAGEKGFFHINYAKYLKDIRPLFARVNSVRIIADKDSLLFGGYFSEVNDKQLQTKNAIPEIAHKWRTIRMDYASPVYGAQSDLEYSFRLKGFDENWSVWTKRTEKEYTNLPPGDYVFEVKVRNHLGNESAITNYSFVVLPPFYLTTWAYLFYLLVLASVIYAIVKWQQKKFKTQRAKFEEEQKRLSYIHELELNKTESELVALRNDKLESEIQFKNSELASSAMHLVKKGELLTKIKADLTQVMKGMSNPQSIADLKKMIRSLSDDDKIDEEWENFTKHFDKVHSDFVLLLKETHPTISNNELKLCAYLRMNLTTKEIAQLLNISVRGVEISRYRLRKKLQLPTEVSLFDYLIGIQKREKQSV